MLSMKREAKTDLQTQPLRSHSRLNSISPALKNLIKTIQNGYQTEFKPKGVAFEDLRWPVIESILEFQEISN